MQRTFNYTDRVRINRQDIRIVRIDGDSVRPEVDISLNLSKYEFDPSPRVYVEAYASVLSTAWIRVDIEDWSRPGSHQRIVLEGFEEVPSVLFNLRAVDPNSGRLLGFAESVPWTAVEDAIADADGILPVERGVIGELAWDVRLNTIGQPVLLLSAKIWPHRAVLLRSDYFRALVLPEVLKRIFEMALDPEGDFDATEPEGHWFAEWIEWLKDNRELSRYVDSLEKVDSDDRSETDEWISDVVGAFAAKRRNRFASTLASQLDSSDQ